MKETAQGVFSIVGRFLLVLIFLMSAVANKIPNYSRTIEYMESKGVPLAQVALPLAIAFLLLGSLSIILGFKARIGAGLLLVFLLLASFYVHDFWNIAPEAKWLLSTNRGDYRFVAQTEMIQFMKNMGLMGAMMFIIANGSGVMSLDDFFARDRKG